MMYKAENPHRHARRPQSRPLLFWPGAVKTAVAQDV